MYCCPDFCPIVDKLHSSIWGIDTPVTAIVDIARTSESRPPAVYRIASIVNTICTIETHPIINP